MSKRNLTDRYIKSRQPAPAGRRDEYHDAIVPGLALRVTDTGHKSFVLIARFPTHPINPTRRAIGKYGAVSLDTARARARQWLDWIERGIDPAVEDARRLAATQRNQVNTFAAVAADFLDRHGRTLKKEAEARSVIGNEFVKRWGGRPAVDITPQDVSTAIRAIVARGAPYQAHNAFGYLRRLYSWAIGTQEFGITSSPVERLSPKDLIGKREPRERTLTDSELRKVWQAAGKMGYPYGPVFRLLILTGQREREVADMSWSEIDLAKRLWTIPGARMKGGSAHEVPLSPAAASLLDALPRFTAGDFVFTTTAGAKPINGFSRAKTRIDRLSGASAWKIHDLRRSMRTHLSALPVQDLVRELVIAHAKPGLHRVYDQHAYQDEKRRCLDLWEKRLLSITEPLPASVMDLTLAREQKAKEIA
jgi:integrase